MDHQQSAFHNLHVHNICDTVYYNIHSGGTGADVHHAHTFSTEDERKLTESGVLGCTTPKGLQHAVFFLITMVNVSAFGVDKSSNS